MYIHMDRYIDRCVRMCVWVPEEGESTFIYITVQAPRYCGELLWVVLTEDSGMPKEHWNNKLRPDNFSLY